MTSLNAVSTTGKSYDFFTKFEEKQDIIVDFPTVVPTATSADSLMKRYMEFPKITYAEFKTLPEGLRKEIIEKNRILQTDTYNRTMGYIKGDDWKKPETYVLQMRKAPHGYLIVDGVRDQIRKFVQMPVTQHELNFAVEFYANARVPFFNREMWQMVIDDHKGYLPLEIYCLPEGTAILPGDPVIRVRGPGELAAHFEPELHRVFYQSLVATAAHEIDQKIGAKRFIEVGKRGTPNEEMHLAAAVAMYDGGGINLTSNDAAVACYPFLKDVGTLGHRFIQFYDTEEEAFERAVTSTDATSLLIDLVDSQKGIEKALALKLKYRETGKKIWIRLDSGNIEQLTLYTLKRYKELGFTDPDLDKVVVEDISYVDEMVKIDKAAEDAGFDAKKHLLYGAGGLLVTKMKERSAASTGYKLSEVDGNPKMKFSDDAGKESIPGQATLVQTNRGRVIAQKGEYQQGEDLFVLAYSKGKMLLTEDSAATRAKVETTFKQVQPLIGQQTPMSAITQEMKNHLRQNYFN